MRVFPAFFINHLSLLLVLTAMAMVLAVTNLAHADVKLSFGLYTSDKPTTLVKKFRPILSTLEKMMSTSLQTDVSIKISISKSYEQGISSLVKGKIDFTRIGPASFIDALRQNPNISLLAMETKKGKKHFKGVICVQKNSPIKNVADLKGKRFAFGNKRSTIGRYLSQEFLLKHGIKADSLQGYDYLGRHDKVGYSVANGQFDAGALKESTFKKLVKKGQSLRKIASFDNVTKPWVARENLNPEIRSALQKALLSIKNKEILKALRKDGFTTASIEDYKDIQDAIKINKIFFSK